MGLVNSKKLFKDAIKGNYAVGAFNFVNLEGLNAIINVAEKLQTPIIIQSSTGALKYAGDKITRGMVYGRCEKSKVPVCWNLDHGKTYEDCKKAVDLGFTNVMIDASSLPYEENIKLTKKVVTYAHKKNVTVEAELGVLAGVEGDVKADNHLYTDPDMVVDFVTRTGVDSLAIAIGTSHGTHKFKGEAKLRFDILKEIEKKLPHFPLVLHGASSIPPTLVEKAEQYGAKLAGASGVPEKMLQKACKMNVCKVNVDSDLRLAFTAGIRQHLTERPENVDIRKFLGLGQSLMEEQVEHKIKKIFVTKSIDKK